MSHPVAALKSLLMKMLFLQDVASIPKMTDLDDQDWMSLLAMVKEHRLGPMLHWRLTRECTSLVVPQALREYSADSFKTATLRALRMQRELIQVHQILKSANIPHAALKGAWLAYHVYPQPGLRPLRDLDILVPESEVLRAFQVLLDGGCTRLPQYDGTPEGWMQHAKHMPPVRAQDGKVNVELHLRLYPPESGGKFGFELSDDAEFWQRCISSEVAGSAVTYLAPTELLLHLIVHAVYDHQFTNGPLLISDLGQVLRKYSIDWPRFWDLANRGGHAKGAVLALRLVESYWGTLPVEWEHAGIGAEEIESDVLEASTQLILRDFEARRDVSLDHALSAQPTLMKKLGLVLGKLMPPKSRMASAYPVSEHSPWVYFWYPAHWWRLLGSRLPEYFAAKGQNHLQKEVVQLAVLNNWLR